MMGVCVRQESTALTKLCKGRLFVKFRAQNECMINDNKPKKVWVHNGHTKYMIDKEKTIAQ